MKCCTNDGNVRIAARLLGVGAVTIMIGLVGYEVAQQIRKGRCRKHLDHKLDLALADSMDCSDPITKY
ncbi:MAG: hypothetical protein ABL962_09355 [Fimbriimonadaceae bacterium]